MLEFRVALVLWLLEGVSAATGILPWNLAAQNVTTIAPT